MEIGSAGGGRQGRRETSTKDHCLGPADYLAFTIVQADRRFTVNSYKTVCQKAIHSVSVTNQLSEWGRRSM